MKKNNLYRIKNSYKKRTQELDCASISELLEYYNYIDSIVEYSKTVISSIVALIIAIFLSNPQKILYPILYGIIHTAIKINGPLLKGILSQIISILIIIVIILLILYLHELSKLCKEKGIINYLLLSKQGKYKDILITSRRRKRRQ